MPMVLKMSGYGIMVLRPGIEVPGSELRQLQQHFPDISRSVKQLGFSLVVMDEEGLISGKLNRVIGH